MFGVLLDIDAGQETESNCGGLGPCRSSRASIGCRLGVDLIQKLFRKFAGNALR